VLPPAAATGVLRKGLTTVALMNDGSPSSLSVELWAIEGVVHLAGAIIVLAYEALIGLAAAVPVLIGVTETDRGTVVISCCDVQVVGKHTIHHLENFGGHTYSYYTTSSST